MTSSAAARSGHLAMTAALTRNIQTLRRAAAKLRGLLPRTLRDSYRPELHYMRGPGPKWRERHTAAHPDHRTAKSRVELAAMTARQGGRVA
jgi:hypothetical protein